MAENYATIRFESHMWHFEFGAARQPPNASTLYPTLLEKRTIPRRWTSESVRVPWIHRSHFVALKPSAWPPFASGIDEFKLDHLWSRPYDKNCLLTRNIQSLGARLDSNGWLIGSLHYREAEGIPLFECNGAKSIANRFPDLYNDHEDLLRNPHWTRVLLPWKLST